MKKDQGDQIGILKSLWKKNSAGVWVVHDIRGVEKRASGGLIAPMMGLDLATGKSLLQLIQDGSEGMAQIMGRGL